MKPRIVVVEGSLNGHLISRQRMISGSRVSSPSGQHTESGDTIPIGSIARFRIGSQSGNYPVEVRRPLRDTARVLTPPLARSIFGDLSRLSCADSKGKICWSLVKAGEISSLSSFFFSLALVRRSAVLLWLALQDLTLLAR